MVLSISQRRKRALEMRDVVFRGCSALGVLLGMWWMVSTPIAMTTCADPPAQRADPAVIITDCASQTIVDGATHYGLGIAGGALLGALVGVLLARMIPVPAPGRARHPRRAGSASTRTTSAATLPLASPPSEASRWITARYSGRCATCSSPVNPGDRVRHRTGRVDCAACWTH